MVKYARGSTLGCFLTFAIYESLLHLGDVAVITWEASNYLVTLIWPQRLRVRLGPWRACPDAECLCCRDNARYKDGDSGEGFLHMYKNEHLMPLCEGFRYAFVADPVGIGELDAAWT